jgi:hypothetical protein
MLRRKARAESLKQVAPTIAQEVVTPVRRPNYEKKRLITIALISQAQNALTSIILAVVSAKNDYANQIVLKLAGAADKTGTRTLGVITKPDTLMQGSASESVYASLAQNLDVEFRLGWHVLRNMDSETGAWSLPKRDREERRFFTEGIWCTLPKSILGIAPLRERLSKLLLGQIAAELLSLIGEIETKSTACRN